MMTENLTILFYSLDFDGHVNSFVGLAERLRDRGHRIVFITNESYREKLIAYGFTPELTREDKRQENSVSAEFWAQKFFSMGTLSDDSINARLEFLRYCNQLILNQSKSVEPFVKCCVDRYRPDLIVVDSGAPSPTLIYSGIPWVSLCSFNPLVSLNDHNLPPGLSGFSTKNDSEKWSNLREKIAVIIKSYNQDLNEWYKEIGYSNTVSKQTMVNLSPHLNVYNYPIELDYSDIITYPSNFYRVDHLMRTKSGVFGIPEQLKVKSGKLIYFSMGSMGSINIQMMSRLISILSQSKHRYIVSKGPLHNEIQLSDNMWGEKSLPQTLILPFVDLVITHGGNNTITEAFYFGKAMIVMPLFADQFDNAQRIHGKGFGVRLNPHSCTKHEFLAAIDQLLTDQTLTHQLKAISLRIQNDNSLEKAAKVIENLKL